MCRQALDATFHYANAPHLLPVKADSGDEVAMRTWYIRDPHSGSIDSASLQTSLLHLDQVWAEEGPFDAVLGGCEKGGRGEEGERGSG